MADDEKHPHGTQACIARRFIYVLTTTCLSTRILDANRYSCAVSDPQLSMLVKAVGPVCRASMPTAEAKRMSVHQRPQHVVICGAGIIGTCTAFFLAKMHGIKTTLVEQHKVAGAASGVGPSAIACLIGTSADLLPVTAGKAGGFLARDWCDGGPSEELMQASFDLHRQLADEFGAEAIGYRPMRSTGLTASSAGNLRGRGRAPAWLDGNVAGAQVLRSSLTLFVVLVFGSLSCLNRSPSWLPCSCALRSSHLLSLATVLLVSAWHPVLLSLSSGTCLHDGAAVQAGCRLLLSCKRVIALHPHMLQGLIVSAPSHQQCSIPTHLH